MAHLFRIDFTHKCDGPKILKAQVRELKKFRRHKRHDDVEAKQADVRSCHGLHGVGARLRRCEINEVLMKNNLAVGFRN